MDPGSPPDHRNGCSRASIYRCRVRGSAGMTERRAVRSSLTSPSLAGMTPWVAVVACLPLEGRRQSQAQRRRCGGGNEACHQTPRAATNPHPLCVASLRSRAPPLKGEAGSVKRQLPRSLKESAALTNHDRHPGQAAYRRRPGTRQRGTVRVHPWIRIFSVALPATTTEDVQYWNCSRRIRSSHEWSGSNRICTLDSWSCSTRTRRTDFTS